MKLLSVCSITCAVALITVLAGSAHAQMAVGTYVRQVTPSTPGVMTVTVEPCCNGGRRLTYHFGDMKQVMVIESPFNGREVPVMVDGKPSGETMAIQRVDARHTSAIVKMNGKPFGVSKCTISADGRTLSVDNEYSASVGGGAAGKSKETWVRK